jgi:hypothetical protein
MDKQVFVTSWEVDLSCGHTVEYELKGGQRRPYEIPCGICEENNEATHSGN